MTSILFLMETIYFLLMQYVRNEKHFLNSFLNFENLSSILNIFEKKMTVTAYVYLKLRTPKNVGT